MFLLLFISIRRKRRSRRCAGLRRPAQQRLTTANHRATCSSTWVVVVSVPGAARLSPTMLVAQHRCYVFKQLKAPSCLPVPLGDADQFKGQLTHIFNLLSMRSTLPVHYAGTIELKVALY